MDATVRTPTSEETLQSIQRELTAFARRSRSRAGGLYPGMPLVAYSMLTVMTERGGCRATDLATYFMLDKSTVSRQVGALEKLGLVVRETDPADHRGQILRPSAAGHRAVEQANEQRRLAFLERLADWADEDLRQFRRCLERYNAAA
ncbi:MarR family winged helix-turn-helix transcriptional regulator [Kitasatospora sp. NPDC048296]|uniref:MarR family winged helix-turn-helix transcriptional regulator n=1 Tax=Kitasatospora sp. NPDC048296 TaxID=3364048 RepID=UPI0037239D23